MSEKYHQAPDHWIGTDDPVQSKWDGPPIWSRGPISPTMTAPQYHPKSEPSRSIENFAGRLQAFLRPRLSPLEGLARALGLRP